MIRLVVELLKDPAILHILAMLIFCLLAWLDQSTSTLILNTISIGLGIMLTSLVLFQPLANNWVFFYSVLFSMELLPSFPFQLSPNLNF